MCDDFDTNTTFSGEKKHACFRCFCHETSLYQIHVMDLHLFIFFIIFIYLFCLLGEVGEGYDKLSGRRKKEKH